MGEGLVRKSVSFAGEVTLRYLLIMTRNRDANDIGNLAAKQARELIESIENTPTESSTLVAAAAPFVGPSRADVLRRLRARSVTKELPMVLGHGEPQAIIRLERGSWVVRQLESDATELREIESRQIREGYYVPEHRFGSLVPGKVLLQHPDLRSFISGLEAMEWAYGP